MTTTDDRPTFQARTVYPISEVPAERRADPWSEAPESYQDVYGWCAPFCVADGPTHARTVEAHGPWCSSAAVVIVDGHAPDVRPVALSASMTQLYTHGVYRKEDLLAGRARHARLVRLALDEGLDDVEGPALLLSSGEVRRLAAGLLHAADAADRLDRDLNDAAVKRDRLVLDDRGQVADMDGYEPRNR